MASSSGAVRHAAKSLRLPPLPSTRDLIRIYKLQAIKQLSQNFLMDNKLSSKIVRSAGRVRGCHVCEVGPGPGNITRSIIEQGASKVSVIEKDRRFLPFLNVLKEASNDLLDIHMGDVLTFNMEQMFSKDLARNWEERPKIHLIGNLPFNVATPLIIRWLSDISSRSNAWVNGRVPMTLTFQHEVAERMIAPPNHPQRCRLSVMCQTWCDVKYVFTIPGRAFIPKPKVDVGVVHLIPRKVPQIPLEFKLVEKVVRCVFSFRQKYCKRGAEQLFPEPMRTELGEKLFAIADVNPKLRPFQLTVEEFNRLCYGYAAIVDNQPNISNFNARGPIECNLPIHCWEDFVDEFM